MSIWKSEPLLTRFWRLLFKQDTILPTQLRHKRSFAVEPLEDRQLLSVSSLAQTDELVETAYIAPSMTVDVADTTSASLSAALAGQGYSTNVVEKPTSNLSAYGRISPSSLITRYLNEKQSRE